MKPHKDGIQGMKRWKAEGFAYDDINGGGTAIDIFENKKGEFIKYSDVQSLEARCKQLEEALKVIRNETMGVDQPAVKLIFTTADNALSNNQ